MKTQKELNKKLLEELKQHKAELIKYKKDFEVEKNIKNSLYFFILNNDLFERLKQFEQSKDRSEDYHLKTLSLLISRLP
ncbi:hypothetical protein GTQ40_15765 [Flavobacteriaceae bacterium R38]|nr:hypothetical protein [Flavobacteriaceae bacterium R38]